MIYKVRAVCHNGHLIMASLFELNSAASKEEAERHRLLCAQEITRHVVDKTISPLCEHCGSGFSRWQFLLEQTSYPSMDSAMQLATLEHKEELNSQAAARFLRQDKARAASRHAAN